eukprot:c43556_g1_i1 orf=275-859(-)
MPSSFMEIRLMSSFSAIIVLTHSVAMLVSILLIIHMLCMSCYSPSAPALVTCPRRLLQRAASYHSVSYSRPLRPRLTLSIATDHYFTPIRSAASAASLNMPPNSRGTPTTALSADDGHLTTTFPALSPHQNHGHVRQQLASYRSSRSSPRQLGSKKDQQQQLQARGAQSLRVGDIDEDEQKRFVPAGPNPLHNR